MPFVNREGELFHYASVGQGAPFFFQHGMGADVGQPLSSAGNLAGWRTIAMDSRGHGQTEASLEPARISFAQFADDLAMLFDSLSIARAVVGGISMGAGIALAFALAHPERVAALILVRPAWLDRPFPRNLRWFPLAADLLQRYSAQEAAKRFAQSAEFSELTAASMPAAESLLGQFRRPRARERARILAGMPASVPVSSLARCQELQVPVLVVVNPRDPVHPDSIGQQLAAAIPRATLSRITSKAESETLHQTDLARTLNNFLERFEPMLRPSNSAKSDEQMIVRGHQDPAYGNNVRPRRHPADGPDESPSR